jgi:hypothetical protein
MKLRIVFSFALVLCLACGALAQVNAPKMGIARYADRTVFQINGLESNLLVNNQLLSSADALSFSDAGGLVAIGGEIQLMTVEGAVLGAYRSTESAPVLNIDNALTTAIAWLPSVKELVRWNGNAFVAIPLSGAQLPGKVTSVQLTSASTARMLATDASNNVFAITVSLAAGLVTSVDLVPGVKGPAFQQYGFVVSHDVNGLHVTAANGSVRTLPLAAPDLTIERMGSDWLHLASTTGEDWVLHLNPAILHLSQLPHPEAVRRFAPRPLQPEEKAQ